MLNDATCFKEVYIICRYTDLRDPIGSAPGSFGHSAVYAFIQDFGPVLCTDLMCDLIHKTTP